MPTKKKKKSILNLGGVAKGRKVGIGDERIYTKKKVSRKIARKGSMKEEIDKKSLNASFKNRVEKFEKYFHDPEQFHKIFTELGVVYVEDGCDGFCPECEQMMKCEVYKEIKDEWE
jgi:hypothetical protein